MKNTLIALFSNENCKFFLWGIVVLFAVLLIVVTAIPPDTCIFMYLTGEKSKLELIKLIGWGISGLIAILGVMGLLQRAAAQDEQNKIMREGQLQEHIKASGERLSSEHASVRIASFNDFYYLATIEPNLRGYSFNTLCLHLRQTTKDENYQKEGKTSGPPESAKIKPTEEVQSLLNILFKPDNKDKFIFDGLIADLEGVYLQGANLQDAHLQNANLQRANLQRACLHRANLQKAKMLDAKMQHAFLIVANLQDALLWNAKLQKANLQGAYLQRAYLRVPGVGMEADMEGADLTGVRINKQTTITVPDGWEKVAEPGKNNSWLLERSGS